MRKAAKVLAIVSFIAVLSGCTGHTMNKEKDCTYDYLLHPAISISKIIGGCEK